MTRPHILDIVEAAGFRVFENGDYNLNIIGVRTPLGAAVPNKFDDVMHLVYKEHGQWKHHKYKITTEPGKYWLLNGRKKGTAVLCSPQQVRGGWQIGKRQCYTCVCCLCLIVPVGMVQCNYTTCCSVCIYRLGGVFEFCSCNFVVGEIVSGIGCRFVIL